MIRRLAHDLTVHLVGGWEMIRRLAQDLTLNKSVCKRVAQDVTLNRSVYNLNSIAVRQQTGMGKVCLPPFPTTTPSLL